MAQYEALWHAQHVGHEMVRHGERLWRTGAFWPSHGRISGGWGGA